MAAIRPVEVVCVMESCTQGLLTVSWNKLGASTLVLFLFVSAATAVGQSIPSVSAESLNGKPISFPKDFAGKPAILIIGFSRGGGGQLESLKERV
jgi:hypothetical protein